MKRISFLLYLIILFGCAEKSSNEFSMNQPDEPLQNIKNKVMLGDTVAYYKLSTAYLDYPPEDFLFWALLMANKYNYSVAYLDVFFSLKDAFNSEADNYDLSEMDEKTKAMALLYLEQAVKMNVQDAQDILLKVNQAESKNSR